MSKKILIDTSNGEETRVAVTENGKLDDFEIESNKKIISLGGGGFINDNIRNEVLLNHISFWLNWDNTTLINRIKSSKKRPIAFKASENEIKKLISDRSKIYSMSNYKINCEKFSKNEIVKKILDIYEKN